MILFRDRATTVLFEVLSTLDKNSKFLLPLNICPIVPETFLKADIKFDFIDINLNTLCMDEVLALEAIKNDSSISGILFVKTFGIDLESEAFFQEVKNINPDIFIIDDKCPSIQNFNFDNSFASLTLFSSGYSKYVDMGYGGFGLLRGPLLKEIFQDNSEDRDFLDYRIAVEKEISLMRKHKAELNSIYRKGIPSYLHLGSDFENWRFSILIDKKDELLKKIFEEDDLFASSHYAPSHYQCSDNSGESSNAHFISLKIVNLFNDFRFSTEKAHRVVKIINSFITDNAKTDT